MAASLSTNRSEFEVEKNGVITYTVQSDLTENLKSLVDLKSFYSELNNLLMNNEKVRFLDYLGDDDGKKEGDFFDYQAPTSLAPTGTKLIPVRTGNAFENHFTWTNHKNGTFEFETCWDFRAPTKFSKYGWFHFHLDLVARVIVEKEVTINGQKKKMLDATWEFRNNAHYKNNIYKKYLSKLAFVKDSPSLMRLYIDHVYYQKILEDITYCENTLLPLVYKVINKHFKSRIELG